MKKIFCSCLLSAVLFSAVAEEGVRQIRFIQDDAQDYMVSKIFSLKYAQANDVMPFLMGIVMRYNMNSSVSCIELSTGRITHSSSL